MSKKDTGMMIVVFIYYYLVRPIDKMFKGAATKFIKSAVDEITKEESK